MWTKTVLSTTLTDNEVSTFDDFPVHLYLKAAKSVTFDLLFLEIMFLIFKNTVIS